MPRSFLEFDGVYTPGRRFAFTNISNEDFTSYWAKVPITVKPMETIEISDVTPIPGPSMGHNLAVKMTMELTDKIIMQEAKMDEMQKNQPYYRSNIAYRAQVPQQRKVYEDKILREMEPSEEGPAMTYIRQQLKEEIMGGGKQEQPAPISEVLPRADFSAAVTHSAPLEGFAELKNKLKSPEPVAAAAKTKKLGRPRKNETPATPSDSAK